MLARTTLLLLATATAALLVVGSSAAPGSTLAQRSALHAHRLARQSPSRCEDDDSSSAYLAEVGTCKMLTSLMVDWCTSNAEFPKRCPKTCGLCGATTTAAPTCRDGDSCKALKAENCKTGSPMLDQAVRKACPKLCDACVVTTTPPAAKTTHI